MEGHSAALPGAGVAGHNGSSNQVLEKRGPGPVPTPCSSGSRCALQLRLQPLAASVPVVLKAAPGFALPALLGQLLTLDVRHECTCAHLELLTQGDLWPPALLV